MMKVTWGRRSYLDQARPPHSAVLVFWLSLETGGKLSEWRGLAIFMFVPVALIPMPGKCMLPEFAE